jgi:hypothetical protein
MLLQSLARLWDASTATIAGGRVLAQVQRPGCWVRRWRRAATPARGSRRSARLAGSGTASSSTCNGPRPVVSGGRSGNPGAARRSDCRRIAPAFPARGVARAADRDHRGRAGAAEHRFSGDPARPLCAHGPREPTELSSPQAPFPWCGPRGGTIRASDSRDTPQIRPAAEAAMRGWRVPAPLAARHAMGRLPRPVVGP